MIVCVWELIVNINFIVAHYQKVLFYVNEMMTANVK